MFKGWIVVIWMVWYLEWEGKYLEFYLEELEMVKRILINFVNNNLVEVNLDNWNVLYILKVGSKKKVL